MNILIFGTTPRASAEGVTMSLTIAMYDATNQAFMNASTTYTIDFSRSLTQMKTDVIAFCRSIVQDHGHTIPGNATIVLLMGG